MWNEGSRDTGTLVRSWSYNRCDRSDRSEAANRANFTTMTPQRKKPPSTFMMAPAAC